jgi:formylglycine-generating enzyme required for sulfatase activity
VTQAQWQAVLGSNPRQHKGADCPVSHVSWHDCLEFCRQLGQHEGLKYTLPTAAEWEYACRAGTTSPYYNGAGEAVLQKVGWYRSNSVGQPHPVGQLAANAWGFFDMHGNIWEWCLDWYGRYPEAPDRKTPLKDPQGPASGKERVLRGGAWSTPPEFCRAAYRGWAAPEICAGHYGMRICCWVE